MSHRKYGSILLCEICRYLLRHGSNSANSCLMIGRILLTMTLPAIYSPTWELLSNRLLILDVHASAVSARRWTSLFQGFASRTLGKSWRVIEALATFAEWDGIFPSTWIKQTTLLSPSKGPTQFWEWMTTSYQFFLFARVKVSIIW